MLKRGNGWKIAAAFIGIMLVGIGVAFNAEAALGNDPVGIVYDGVRSALNLTSEQLGMASNMVNLALMVLVFFTGRHYLNIGTFIYVLPYGFAVDLGGKIYHWIFRSQILPEQIAGAVMGCLMLYVGVALFIAVDMGVDPFTGVVMILKDRLHMEYRKVKIGFDVCMMILGVILGGRLGVVTLVTAVTAGPCIQAFSNIWKKYLREGDSIYGKHV